MRRHRLLQPGVGFEGSGQGFDIGAYEYQLPPSATATETPLPTETPFATETPIPTMSPTDTSTAWPTETETASMTFTFIPTITETPLPTGTTTVTPTHTPLPTDTPLPADIDEDHKVDTLDLLQMLGVWNSQVGSASQEDLNADSRLNMDDLGLRQQLGIVQD